MKNSGTYGSNYQKEQFDDSDFIASMDNVKIKEIHLYDNGVYLAGIQVFYNICDQVVTPGLHCTTDIESIDDPKKWKDYNSNTIRKFTLELEDDEFINRVEVRSGAIIDKVTCFTNKGRSVAAGGNGGSMSNYSYSNHKLGAFIGSHSTKELKESTWPTIHHLQVCFVPCSEEENLTKK